ncbi:hypothetical protein [Paenibacillus sanguinis]|uniref:hypothetical protein n=1 Tax=Paenibacillus sanguinis TaxID=225906 RepID=UPI00037E0A4D|nr:hypothetical protein [Paenibacillus sanguinis]
MTIPQKAVEMDYILERVLENFACRVLWSEGRPCLEYHLDQLDAIAEYVRTQFGTELLDVFFTAVERLEEE